MWHTNTGTKGAIVKGYQLNGELLVSFKDALSRAKITQLSAVQIIYELKKRKRMLTEISLHTSWYYVRNLLTGMGKITNHVRKSGFLAGISNRDLTNTKQKYITVRCSGTDVGRMSEGGTSTNPLPIKAMDKETRMCWRRSKSTHLNASQRPNVVNSSR